MLYSLSDQDLLFPSPRLCAHPSGVLAVGGDLRPERLLLGYSLGLFPWYSEGHTPPLWHAPHERMALFPERLVVNRSLRRALNRNDFEVRYDTAFEEVLEGCAGAPRPGQDGTWLHAPLRAGLLALHRAGYAHSAEAWLGGELVGGLYGVTLGRVFFGESMFTRVSDASKVAFVTLVRELVALGYTLIDCQAYTDNLARFGAEELEGELFYELLCDLTARAPRAVWPTGAGERRADP